MTAALHDALRAACADIGIVYRDVPAYGRFHETDIEGDPRGRGDGRIKLFPDCQGGVVCNWKGETRPFFADDGRKLSEAERRERERKRQETILHAKEDEANRHAEARKKAAAIWNAAQSVEDHPYLHAKRIKALGLRVHGDALVIPLRDTAGVLHSLQFIGPDGEKRFLTGGRMKGCYYSIGKPNGTLCIAEGYATAASVHEATGHAVAVAFNAGNLVAVARALRGKLTDERIVICADNDIRTET